MKTFTCLALLAAMALGLAACGDSPSPAQPASAATPLVKPQVTVGAGSPAGSAGGATADASPYVYTYNPLGKRDPFRSPMEDLHRASQDTVASACSDPLCQWDLDQLKLVAVVTGDSNPMAMVEDPMGRGHVIRRNARMGKQGGKVTQILRDSVTVTEYFPGTDGKVMTNPVSLDLATDQKRDTAYNLLTGKNWE